jgi:putative ABC transport system permease protein
MWMYYLRLGFNSLRRNPILTTITVLILGIGIAASMSTLTILYVMSGNPIPHKSDRLFVPQFDTDPMDGYKPGEEPAFQVTYKDAMNLLRDAKGIKQTAMYGVAQSVDSRRKDLPLFPNEGIATTADAFTMFEIPFLHGQGWTANEDRTAAQVVVIGNKLAKKIFGKTDVVGQTLRLDQRDYRITGVIADWQPLPKYYRVYGSGAAMGPPDEIWIPFSNATSREYANNGWTNCNGESDPGYQGFLNSECQWIQYWVELKSANDAAAFKDYMSAYVATQKKLGRMPRPENNRFRNVMAWLQDAKVVEQDAKISGWLSLGFLLVCIVNMMALLLAKFTARNGDVAVRRALGASRWQIFQQFALESFVIGCVGAAIGVALSFLALRLMANGDNGVSALYKMDAAMLSLTVCLSIVASLIAGLLPTWRACQVLPALQLKSQ